MLGLPSTLQIGLAEDGWCSSARRHAGGAHAFVIGICRSSPTSRLTNAIPQRWCVIAAGCDAVKVRKGEAAFARRVRAMVDGRHCRWMGTWALRRRTRASLGGYRVQGNRWRRRSAYARRGVARAAVLSQFCSRRCRRDRRVRARTGWGPGVRHRCRATRRRQLVISHDIARQPSSATSPLGS